MPVAQGSAGDDTHQSTRMSTSRVGPQAASSMETRTPGQERMAVRDRSVREEPRPTRPYRNPERTNDMHASQSMGTGRVVRRTVADKGSPSGAAGEVDNSQLSEGQSYPPKSDTTSPYPIPSEGKTGSPARSRPSGEHIPIEDDEDIVMALAYAAREREEGPMEQDARVSSRPPAETRAEASYAAAASGHPGTHDVPMQPGLQAHPPPPPPNEVPRAGEGDSENRGYETAPPTSSGGGGLMSKLFGPSYKDKFYVDKIIAELEQTKEDLRRAKSESRYYGKQCRDLYTEREHYREQLVSAQNELKIVHNQLEDSRQLSEVRGKELLGAQVFLTKADLLSASEVIQKVNDLNDEILQTAALLSESLHHTEAQWSSDEEKETSWRRARRALGEHMLRTVANASNEPSMNPFLAQLTLQVCLTDFCRWKISTWYEEESATNKFLEDIYNKIRSTEEQAVSGRWRAITHANTRLSTDEWASQFFLRLNHVLALANWSWKSEVPSSALDNKLQPIFKGVLDLRIALGEQFTSADICPSVIPSETPFDPQTMRDGLSDDRSNGRKQDGRHKQVESVDIVVATLGLGLFQQVRQGAQKGTWEHQILLMPSVILQSTLMELLQPPSPRKGKSGRTKDVHS